MKPAACFVSSSCSRFRWLLVPSKSGQGTWSAGAESAERQTVSLDTTSSLTPTVNWMSELSTLSMAWRTATGVLDGSKTSSSDRLATRTKQLYGSLLMRVGTISSPLGRGWARGEARRWQAGFCLPVTRMVVMELAGMWQRDVVRATPWVVVRCCNRISRTTAWRHEGTSLAEAGSGGKHERRTFIPTKIGSRLLRCCVLSSVGSLTTRTGTSGHLFPKMSMSTSRMPEYGTSVPLTARSVRKACCSERSCRWAAAHVSVTVVTSLPVSSSAATSCPLMRIVVVGHLPISPVVFLPPVARLVEATGVRSFLVAVLRAGHAVAAGTAAWTGIEPQCGHVVGTTNIQGCVGHWSQAFCQVVGQPRCSGWVRLCSGSGVGAAASGWRSPLRARRFAFPAGGDCRGWGLLAAAQRWCQGSCLPSSSGGPLWWHRRMLRLHSRECSALCLSSETRDEAHPQRCPAAW